MAIIECVPNISEGRRAEVVARIVEAVHRVPGARLLDYSSDASHNRSVLTMAGDRAPLKDAILAMFDIVLAEIDLRTHTGEHPRLGAVDVVPFVPIEDVTMEDCVALAKDTARSVAERFAVPVYLYEEASSNALRKNLEDIRRGEFEGLAAKMATPGWAPDFGPPQPHPTAGASVIDHHGAALFALGIIAAIVRRQRTGQGCRVDASLMQSALDLQAESLVAWINAPMKPPGPQAFRHVAGWYFAAPYGVYATRDGHMAISLSPLAVLAKAIDEKVLPEGDWQRHQMKSLLGEALLGLGRRVEAEPLIVEGYEGMKGNPAVPPDRLRQAEARVELLRTTH